MTMTREEAAEKLTRIRRSVLDAAAAEALDLAIAALGGGEVVGEVRLWDTQWMNVVNHDRCYAGWDVEDAINHAVKLTERYIADNVRDNKLPPPRPLPPFAARRNEMSKRGDEPAYPAEYVKHAPGAVGNSVAITENGSGMTLREHYAGLAMQGLAAYYGLDNAESMARTAVRQADALLIELSKAQP